MVTGIVGGVVRDVLVAEVPAVLSAELYAVTALAGAAIVVLGDSLHLPSSPVAIAGVLVRFALRTGAIQYGWRLPVAGKPR